MPTISSERRPVKLAALLCLLGANGTALASGTIEFDPRTENFTSRAACEQALERRYRAAMSRLEALPAKERRTSRVDTLRRDRDEQLGYVEVVDLSVDTP